MLIGVSSSSCVGWCFKEKRVAIIFRDLHFHVSLDSYNKKKLGIVQHFCGASILVKERLLAIEIEREKIKW